MNADRKIYEEWTSGTFSEAKVDDDSEYIKGASLAIWCDMPNLVTEEKIAVDIYNEMRAFATKTWNMNSNSIQSFEEFKGIYNKL